MAEYTSIWAPVIIGELIDTRKVSKQFWCALNQSFCYLEDIKIKIKEVSARLKGQVIETNIKMEMLFLLQDVYGKFELIKKEDHYVERISTEEINCHLDKDKEVDIILRILDLNWKGELLAKEVCITYYLEYMVYITKEQVVELRYDYLSDIARDTLQDMVEQLKMRLKQLENENRDLNKKVFFYERNLASLKKGVRKAETQNAVLNNQIRNYQDIIENLHQVIKEQDNNNLKNLNYHSHQESNHENSCNDKSVYEQEEPISFGSRIKRMFLNSL